MFTDSAIGAILTHTGFSAVAASLMSLGLNFTPDGTCCMPCVHHRCNCELPAAGPRVRARQCNWHDHVWRYAKHAFSYPHSVPIAFYRGDVTLLFEDIAEIRPTIFCSVPRLYNRIYSAILAKTLHSGSAIAAALFSRGLAAKLDGLKTGHLTHAFWDRIMFNKIKNVLGGRVRLMISGSAPISGMYAFR